MTTARDAGPAALFRHTADRTARGPIGQWTLVGTIRRVIRHDWLLVLLAVLAVARLTRLVNEDAILDRPRAAVQRSKTHDSLVYFVTCPWCVSIWVGAGVAAAVWAWPCSWWVQVPLLALAASYVTGYLATILLRIEG